MLATLAALALIPKPLLFPPKPISAELERGEKVYYRKRGVERVFQEDRATIGWWFDGSKKKDVDDVIWLSPSLISRWLGYLNAKEKWSQDELQRRWEALSQILNGRMTFVVEAYALPKQSFFEITDDGPSKPATATNLRFSVSHLTTAPGDHREGKPGLKLKEAPLTLLTPEVSPLATFRGYSLDAVNKWDWFALDRRFELLTPEFSGPKPTPYDGIVGDYLRVIYIVQVAVPEEPIEAKQIELRVFAPGKEPVARFNLTAKSK